MENAENVNRRSILKAKDENKEEATNRKVSFANTMFIKPFQGDEASTSWGSTLETDVGTSDCPGLDEMSLTAPLPLQIVNSEQTMLGDSSISFTRPLETIIRNSQLKPINDPIRVEQPSLSLPDKIPDTVNKLVAREQEKPSTIVDDASLQLLNATCVTDLPNYDLTECKTLLCSNIGSDEESIITDVEQAFNLLMQDNEAEDDMAYNLSLDWEQYTKSDVPVRYYKVEELPSLTLCAKPEMLQKEAARIRALTDGHKKGLEKLLQNQDCLEKKKRFEELLAEKAWGWQDTLRVSQKERNYEITALAYFPIEITIHNDYVDSFEVLPLTKSSKEFLIRLF